MEEDKEKREAMALTSINNVSSRSEEARADEEPVIPESESEPGAELCSVVLVEIADDGRDLGCWDVEPGATRASVAAASASISSTSRTARMVNNNNSDEELGMPLVAAAGHDIDSTDDDDNDHCYHFEIVCRLAIRLALAAMKFGSNADRVERFLPRVMVVFGYGPGIFRCGTNELICKFEYSSTSSLTNSDNNGHSRMDMVQVQTGFALIKLGLLSDLVKDLLEGKLTNVQQASERLDRIEQEPDPWGSVALGASFLMAGGGLPVVFNGSWWDVLCGTVAGGGTFVLLTVFETFSEETSVWLNLVASFFCSALAATVKLLMARPEVNVTVVTVSGVIVLVPGASITLGVTDLVTKHIISGFSRIITGLVAMLWLSLGYWLGIEFVQTIADAAGVTDATITTAEEDPVPFVWHILFIPILCLSVPVLFQMKYKDMVWAIASMFVAYAVVILGNQVTQRQNLATFLASFTVAIFSNTWSRWYDRPNTIVLMPAFLLLVSGSVGFLGLMGILEGDTQNGKDQFFQMFIVAGLIIAGIMGGSTVVRPQSTI